MNAKQKRTHARFQRNAKANLGHELVFPNLTRLADLFDEVREWEKDAPDLRPVQKLTPGRRASAVVGNYCIVRGLNGHEPGLQVRASEMLVTWLRANMIDVDYDRFHFGLVDHGNGFALLYVSYGQIIGSRWLAYIESATIPAPVVR